MQNLNLFSKLSTLPSKSLYTFSTVKRGNFFVSLALHKVNFGGSVYGLIAVQPITSSPGYEISGHDKIDLKWEKTITEKNNFE